MDEEGSLPAIGLYETIHTARSLRRFTSDPVPEPLITQILDAAIRAPRLATHRTGRSSWCVILECGVALGTSIAASRIAEAMYAARGRPAHVTQHQFERMMSTGAHLSHGRGAGDSASLSTPSGSAPCRVTAP